MNVIAQTDKTLIVCSDSHENQYKVVESMETGGYEIVSTAANPGGGYIYTGRNLSKET